MTQSLGKLFIDIETTGLGQFGQYKNNPVAIWNFGYIDSGSNVSQELIADIGNVPFEDGALEVYKPQGLGPYRGKENAVPKVYSEYMQTYGQNADDEKAMLQKIGNLFKQNKGRTIAGYNIASFDIPFIAERFKHHGMTDELKALEGLHIEDTLEKAKSFLRKRMPSSFLAQLGPATFDEATRTRIYDLPDGFKLDILAEAFGISSQAQAHTAEADAKLTKALDDILNDPQEAKKRYSLSRHIAARDARVSASYKGKPDVDIIKWETIAKQLGGPEALEEANNGLVEGSASDWTYKEPPKLAKDVLRTSSIIDNTTQSSANTPAGNAVNTIKNEASSVVNNARGKISQNFDNAIQLSKNIFTPKNALIAGAVIGAGLIYKSLKSDNANDRDAYISATNLGKKPGEVIKQYKLTKGKNLEQDIGQNPIADIGTRIHSIIEEEFAQKGFSYESEVSVYDDELKVQGRIDILGKLNDQKIPIEVKSVSAEKFAGLAEPDYEYASQANLYAHATNAPGAYVLYVNAENLKQRKAFYVPYSPERLIRDVADLRSALIETGAGGYTKKWLMQMEDFFDSPLPSGIRNESTSSSGYDGYEAMKPHGDHGFPGGRAKAFIDSIEELTNVTKTVSNSAKVSIPATAARTGRNTKNNLLISSVSNSDHIPSQISNATNNSLRKHLSLVSSTRSTVSQNNAPFIERSKSLKAYKQQEYGSLFRHNNKSKLRDQATKGSHLFPIGTPNNGNIVHNASRFDQRNL